MKPFLPLFFSLVILAAFDLFADAPKTLDVPRRDANPLIDGRPDDAVWATVPVTTDFGYPWRKDAPQKTSLRIFYNDSDLCLLFEVEDATPVFKADQRQEMDIAEEDRVEVYFAADSKMKDYYSIEMSPTGLALDYRCSFHRKFDFTWRFPGLALAGEKRPDGYTVEATYPLAALKRLGVLKEDGTILTGFYRADFEKDDAGKIVEKWISWINPGKPEEDFHVPETLGQLRLP